MSNKDYVASTIDRITANALAASSTSQTDFIASPTWQGPKRGYYFGTSSKGTGYYLDNDNKQNENESTIPTNGNRKRKTQNDDPSQSSQRRKVRFGQDQIRLIPKKSPDELLEEAEEEQKARNTKSLDLTRGPSSLKSFVHNLEKSIAKNGLLRLECADEPEKFMQSEVALYEDIAVLNDLATNVEYYTTFVELGTVDQLLALLAHENTDVALAVIRLFMELLDPALFVREEDKGLSSLMMAFVGSDGGKNGGLGLVIANLSRLRENEEEEMKGIDDIFNLIENLLDLDQMGVLRLASDDENDYNSIVSSICEFTSFVGYLMTNLRKKNDDSWDTTLKLHASELLATILQHEDSRRHITKLNELDPFTSELEKGKETKRAPIDGIECLLQCVASYRKKDPVSDEECEYLENICNGLAASFLNDRNVEAFLEGQGVELMLRCINEGVHSGFGSLKVLLFAILGPVSSNSKFYKNAAETLVEAGGLKMLFPIFMGKRSAMPKPSRSCDAGNLELLRKFARVNEENGTEKKKSSKKMKQVVVANKDWYRTIEENSIQILYGLTRHLNDNSPHDAKARLVAKFVENECEKCDRMIELCLKYDAKMRHAEYMYFKSDEAEEAEASGIDIDMAALNAKLEGGGEIFHRISSVIACAASGSKRCHEHLLHQLRTQNSGIGGKLH
jgi:beta-catenin-like protein 1